MLKYKIIIKKTIFRNLNIIKKINYNSLQIIKMKVFIYIIKEIE